MAYIRTYRGDQGLGFELAFLRNRPEKHGSTTVLLVDDGTFHRGLVEELSGYDVVTVAEPGGLETGVRAAVAQHLCQVPDPEGVRRIHVMLPENAGELDDIPHALRWVLLSKDCALDKLALDHPSMGPLFAELVPVVEDECAQQLFPYL